jgi:hypothetical protein
VSQLIETAGRGWGRLPPWIRSINGRLALWLAVLVGCLFLAVGAVSRWHQGGGAQMLVVDIIWRTVWIVYQILKVWLIVVIAILIYRRAQGSSH